MKPLPYHRLHLETNLSPEEVLRLIDNYLTTKKNARQFLDFSAYLNGRVKGNRFTLMKRGGGRNSFRPIIKGTVSQNGTGAHIKISMRLHFFVTAFMFVWLYGVGAACLSAFVSGQFSAETLIPFGMLIFGIALPGFGFWSEAKDAEAKLRELIPENAKSVGAELLRAELYSGNTASVEKK